MGSDDGGIDDLDDLLLCEVIRYGMLNKQEMIGPLASLYRQLATKMSEEDRYVTRGDVMPLGIAHQGSRLYLVCRFRDFDNERTLAINRILNAKALTLPFDPPKEFSLEKYEDEGALGLVVDEE